MDQIVHTGKLPVSNKMAPFILNALIAFLYLLLTCIIFIIEKDPDPIGTGLRQWAAIILHFIFLILFYLFAAKKPGRWKKFGYATGGLLSVVIVYFLLTSVIWSLL